MNKKDQIYDMIRKFSKCGTQAKYLSMRKEDFEQLFKWEKGVLPLSGESLFIDGITVKAT